jgi:hypothetical protein
VRCVCRDYWQAESKESGPEASWSGCAAGVVAISGYTCVVKVTGLLGGCGGKGRCVGASAEVLCFVCELRKTPAEYSAI